MYTEHTMKGEEERKSMDGFQARKKECKKCQQFRKRERERGRESLIATVSQAYAPFRYTSALRREWNQQISLYYLAAIARSLLAGLCGSLYSSQCRNETLGFIIQNRDSSILSLTYYINLIR